MWPACAEKTRPQSTKRRGGDGVKKGRYEPCRSSKGCLKLPSKMRKKMWAPWEAKEAAVEHKPGQCRRRTCGPSAQERHGHPEGEALAAKRADQADLKKGWGPCGRSGVLVCRVGGTIDRKEGKEGGMASDNQCQEDLNFSGRYGSP